MQRGIPRIPKSEVVHSSFSSGTVGGTFDVSMLCLTSWLTFRSIESIASPRERRLVLVSIDIRLGNPPSAGRMTIEDSRDSALRSLVLRVCMIRVPLGLLTIMIWKKVRFAC